MGRKKYAKAKLNKKEKQMKKAHNELVKFLKLAFRRDKFKAHKELKKKQQAEKEMEEKVKEKKKEKVLEREIDLLERYFSESSLDSDEEQEPPAAAAAIPVQ